MNPEVADFVGKGRFTRDGSLELEQRLAALCQRIGMTVQRLVPSAKLKALVLGGGYGRGQGGVLKLPTGDAPYNDLEFYVFLGGGNLLNQAKYRKDFERLGEVLSLEAGFHVEFKLDSLDKLRRGPVTIFSYDLVSGHKIIVGPDAVFRDCEHHLNAGNISPTEPARLLLNRCSGLLLVKELLLNRSLTFEQCDFVGRNLEKAKLALGDALLAASSQYHWDCLERSQRLGRLAIDCDSPFIAQVLKLHSEGVQFKLHPIQQVKSLEEFKREHVELTPLALKVWLWIENLRLRANFSTVREYSFSSLEKCSGTGAWRNLLLNCRSFGAGAAWDRNAPRYPRERLLNTLPLLLETEVGAVQGAITRHLQHQLHTCADDWHGLVAAYKQIWQCYG